LTACAVAGAFMVIGVFGPDAQAQRTDAAVTGGDYFTFERLLLRPAPATRELLGQPGGWGLSVIVPRHVPLLPDGAFALRYDAAFVHFERDRRSDPAAFDRELWPIHFGAQIQVPTGRIRPYVSGGIGGTLYFVLKDCLPGCSPKSVRKWEPVLTTGWTAGVNIRLSDWNDGSFILNLAIAEHDGGTPSVRVRRAGLPAEVAGPVHYRMLRVGVSGSSR
jgi:hypothetical protein